MNSQQLKDLAEQAGFLTFAGPDIHAPEDPYSDGCAAQLAKFAELIIRECLVLNKKTCEELKADDCVLSGYKTLLNLYMISMRNSIEEHFGVEE